MILSRSKSGTANVKNGRDNISGYWCIMTEESITTDGIPLNWRPGDVIADLYEVKGTAEGGMGSVYFATAGRE